MHLCIFNPEHDLCLAKGRAHYVPPRSAVEFARRDADLMQVLYPDARCFSVYDERLRPLLPQASRITAWGWDAVVRWELQKRGAPKGLLPTDEQLSAIRRLQHRSSVLPLQQGEAWAVESMDEVENLLRMHTHIVLKAPWSGAGRGLRWLHSAPTQIDRSWLSKTVREQRMAIAERRHDVVADLALEYMLREGAVSFVGYSLFRTGSGVYKDNIMLSDAAIEHEVGHLTAPHADRLQAVRERVEQWLVAEVLPHYSGPLGVDLMVDSNKHIYLAEMNLRHTMGMVAHARCN